MTGLTQNVVSDGGVSISYTVLDGAAPAVVILHGLAGSSREFLPTAHALAGRKVVLVDQRGHGSSTRIPADTSRKAFVADVVRVLETEKLVSVDLVGQSMGAHTAMLVAASRPDLVRRLVLLECDAGSGTVEEAEAMGEYFRSWKVPYATREIARAALGDSPLAQTWVADLEGRDDGFWPRFDAGVMVQTITHVGEPRWEEWESITTPTLVVYAEHGMFTQEQKDQFTERGANVTRVDLADASHDAHLDAFNPWISALTTFIDAC
ncbi:alpha/beta hydrolase [Arthrobacter sp. RIT-PI-e]|uniref:alpha/beta fold hydrolase n=1 Tax=Arthrobacter sp. RIT-PI-e TaxID=1681197 RepID=UPI00067624F4|nr:alpha/beta hydrolase [Arthrobacter sp. RIT-PI-e]KNC19062.1 alpha/beta hydrolase [Arthrobacter sp. RIT-PI-e]